MFPDLHKKVILMNTAPTTIREHLFIDISQMTSYEVTKREVAQYIRSKRTYGPNSGKKKKDNG